MFNHEIAVIIAAARGGSTDLTDVGDLRALNKTGDSADLTKPGESTQLDGEDSREEVTYGPCHEKTCLWGFRQSEIQTSLLSCRD